MRKLLSIVLCLSVILGGVSPLFANDTLSPPLLSGDMASAGKRTDVAKEVKPGAIADGTELEALLRNELPERIPVNGSGYVQSILDMVRYGTFLAIRSYLENRAAVPEEYAGRAREAYENLLKIYYYPKKHLYLFRSKVNGYSDYNLGFSSGDKIGLSVGLISFLNHNNPDLLAQYIFHECVPERPCSGRDDHRLIYTEIQTPIFGVEAVEALGEQFRFFMGRVSAPDEFTDFDFDDYLAYAEYYAGENNTFFAMRYYGYVLEIGKILRFRYDDIKREALKYALREVKRESKKTGKKKKGLLLQCLKKLASYGCLEYSRILLKKAAADNPDDEDIKTMLRIDIPELENNSAAQYSAHVESKDFLEDTDNDAFIFHAKMALRLRPDSLKDRNELFLKLDKLMRAEEAERLALKACEMHPDSLLPRLNLATLYYDFGLYERAINLCKDIFALNTELERRDPDLKKRKKHLLEVVMVNMRIGDAYLKTGDLEGAQYYYDEAVNTYPENKEKAMINSLSVKMLKFVRRDPDTNEIMDFLNTEYFSKGDKEKALFRSAVIIPGTDQIINGFVNIFSPDKYFDISTKQEAMEFLADIGEWKAFRLIIGELKHPDFPAFNERLLSILRDNRKFTLPVLREAAEDIKLGARYEIELSDLIDLIDELSDGFTLHDSQNIEDADENNDDLSHNLWMEHHADTFMFNLQRISEQERDEKIVIAVDTDLGDGQGAQLMEIYKALDLLKNLKKPNGAPLLPNVVLVRGKGKDLMSKIDGENVDYDNVFLLTRLHNVEKLFSKLTGKGWITAIDDGRTEIMSYMPILESLALSMMAYLGANLDSMEIFAMEFSGRKISQEDLLFFVKKRFIMILPKATEYDADSLRNAYKLIYDTIARFA